MLVQTSRLFVIVPLRKFKKNLFVCVFTYRLVRNCSLSIAVETVSVLAVNPMEGGGRGAEGGREGRERENTESCTFIKQALCPLQCRLAHNC